MCTVIADEKLKNAFWGIKFRVYFGAGLSILDCGTDLVSIKRFYDADEMFYCYMNLGFIIASIFFQLIWGAVQNRKQSKVVMAKEAAIVVFLLKPAIDAKRVATANAHMEGSLVDPKMDLTVTKFTEMFTESVPSSILQSYAIIGATKKSKGAAFSIFISACTIAYSSVTVSIGKFRSL